MLMPLSQGKCQPPKWTPQHKAENAIQPELGPRGSLDTSSTLSQGQHTSWHVHPHPETHSLLPRNAPVPDKLGWHRNVAMLALCHAGVLHWWTKH